MCKRTVRQFSGVYACSRIATKLMALHRSLDESKIIAALLHCVQQTHGAVFNYSSLQKTLRRIDYRLSKEGFSFLAKTLPCMGKAFDKALAEDQPMTATRLRCKAMPGSKLPKLFGELLMTVLKPDGTVLPDPSTKSIGVLRDIYYVFYKYGVPYDSMQERKVVQKFQKTEDDLTIITEYLEQIQMLADEIPPTKRIGINTSPQDVVRGARSLLSDLFAHFDPTDIYPKHGPGVVATKQRLWAKYDWTNVSDRITSMYPLDAYFMASQGHVCDTYREFNSLGGRDLPAQVLLVPKDSRGPRLISCEPVDFQWIEQGLGRAIVEHVEKHELTQFNVFFTNQQPNQCGALLGSLHGKYATLDLNEASDRVSVALVRLLFPSHICEYLEACRTTSTRLPNGGIQKLLKFAPMGSTLCFPIMALTIWAILTSAAPDQYTSERILVYGDDVIVTTAYAVDAMKQLSSFGLKINKDKSCVKGFFRESCGTDAYKGVNVTPVRLRTVWSHHPSPDVFESWIAYANSFFNKQYVGVYDLIVRELFHIYGSIPDKSMELPCPSLVYVPPEHLPKRTRSNKRLQKREWNVWSTKAPAITKCTNSGWSMLLRFFAEAANDRNRTRADRGIEAGLLPVFEAFRVRKYTSRRTNLLVRRWMSPVKEAKQPVQLFSERREILQPDWSRMRVVYSSPSTVNVP